MDLLCPICLEPWDNDTFHEVAQETDSTYQAVTTRFRRSGCGALGTTHGDHRDAARSQAVETIYGLLGDDMDGAASLIEDFGIGG